MNKLAVIAAFLALSSCATFSGDPESPDASPPRQTAPSTDSGSAGATDEAPAPAPDAPPPDAPEGDAGAETTADDARPDDTAEGLSEPEAPLGPVSPRMPTSPEVSDESTMLPAPALPPASDALIPDPRLSIPDAASDSEPTQAARPQPPAEALAPAPPSEPEPAPDPAPAAAPDAEPEAVSDSEPVAEPEVMAEPEARRERDAPQPEPAPQPQPQPEPEPAPEPQREPQPGQRDDAPAAAQTPAPPVSGTREATVGEEMRVSLGDGGWVYLGEESGDDGLSFRRRYSEDGETVFVFSVEAPGDYVVRFQRQDLDRGVFREERMAVEARPESAGGVAGTPDPPNAPPADGDPANARPADADLATAQPADGGMSPAGEGEPATSADLDEAYALLDEGRREAALDAFLQSYPVGDPEVHALIARLAYDLGRWETARSHWSRNLDADEPFARGARLGLFRTALETDDAESAWEQFRQLRQTAAGQVPGGAGEAVPESTLPETLEPEVREPGSIEPGTPLAAGGVDVTPAAGITEEELLQLGNLLLESADPSRAVDPLEAYMDAGGTPDDPAELYYRLGRLYEDRRDARAAMEYYRRIVDDFPLSRHWQPAEERVQYLKRHFFDIR